jgi:predicted phage baseplate assembly protein
MDLPAAAIEDDRQRRADARAKGLNGIDYIEVGEDTRVLRIVFFGAPPDSIDTGNFSITGGVRVRDIRPVELRVHDTDDSQRDFSASLTVNRAGDFSTYTLAISGVEGFDPHYSRTTFTFRTSASHLDCRANPAAAPVHYDEPDIDYLAKDYESFRQIILNRLALIMPGWTETHVPDVGITLVELFAYVGDYLSYYQDAVATEAYLNTARRRISVRRHARLVDYAMHEGCNARTWLCIATDADSVSLDPATCSFVTDCAAFAADAGPVMAAASLRGVSSDQYEVFQPVTRDTLTVRAAHSRISFHAWGARRYVLPAGATSATLIDTWLPAEDAGAAKAASAEDAAPAAPAAQSSRAAPTEGAHHAGKKDHAGKASETAKAAEARHAPPPAHAETPAKPAATPGRALANLRAGDCLAIEEVRSPATGEIADADPLHRHVVRLTQVEATLDPVYDQPIVNVAWAAADALPFELVLAGLSPPPACAALGAAGDTDLFVACSNVWLIDHGRAVSGEALDDDVPGGETFQPCEDAGMPGQVTTTPGLYRPRLAAADLTFRVPPDTSDAAGDARRAAAAQLTQDPGQAMPCIALSSIPGTADGTGPLFTFADLADPSALARRLKTADDATAHLLRQRLSHHARQGIEKLDDKQPVPPTLLAAMRRALEPLVVRWQAQPDLLASAPGDAHYVVEIDDGRVAQLRFGDGRAGRVPEAGSTFSADYRVGNGLRGDVGHDAIAHLVVADGVLSGGITRVWNPLAAQGGTDPESVAEVRMRAPGAFRRDLARVISPDDYARIVERHAGVRTAAAMLRWTGSRYAVKVAIAPFGSEDADAALRAAVAQYLEQYRRIGHDVEVTAAAYVPLDIALFVRVAPDYVRGEVMKALLDIFSARILPGAAQGFFYPDRQHFGADVHASVIIATAQRVEGVAEVRLERFERLYEGPNGEIESGVLRILPHEIPQLDNDPNYPERGRLKLIPRGGR